MTARCQNSESTITGTLSSSSITPVTPTNASPEKTEFLQDRATLAAKMATVNISDPQALAQFQQQNADLLKRQAQLAQVIAQQQTVVLPMPPPLQIQANASTQLQAYLTARDSLMRDEIAFTNQHLNDDAVTKAAALQQWRTQNATRIQNIQQLGQTLSDQQAKTLSPIPPPLQLPPNASPQLQAYLTARDQLARDEIAFTNQHLSDAPAVKEAAIQQWKTQNATRIQNLQQLAQAVSTSN